MTPTLKYSQLNVILLSINIFIVQSQNNTDTTSKYRAINWNIQDGLASSSVFFTKKDIYGFLWIGTRNGLSRFDGCVFKNYYHVPGRTGTFNASESNYGMEEDSLHNLWIGTNNGLYRYDHHADTFSQVIPVSLLRTGLLTIPFQSTTSEIMCIEYKEISIENISFQIVSYNSNSLMRKEYATIENDTVGAPFQTSAFSYFDSTTNSVWLLRNWLDRSTGSAEGVGILEVNLTTGIKKVHKWPCFQGLKRHNHSAIAMEYDFNRHCLWLNSQEGLIQFTLNDKQFHLAYLNNNISKRDADGFFSGGITIDNKKRIWFASKIAGIVIYDPSNRSIDYPFIKDREFNKMLADKNALIYCDIDNNIWLGYWNRKGLYQIQSYLPAVTPYQYKASMIKNDYDQNKFRFLNFICGNENILWYSAPNNGFGTINMLNNKLKSYQYYDLKIEPVDRVKRLFDLISIHKVDTINHKIYISDQTRSPGGQYVLELNTMKCKSILFKDSTGKIINLQGNLFAGFRNDLIISGYSEDGTQIICEVDTHIDIGNQIFSLAPSEIYIKKLISFDKGYLFLLRSGDNNNLTYRFDNSIRKWYLSPSIFDTYSWNNIISDREAGFWLTGERQLIHFDRDFKKLRTYTPADGLPEIEIHNLIEDLRGNLWFNTDRAIYQFNIQTEVISKLTEKDGFDQYQFQLGSNLLEVPNGNIYIPLIDSGFIKINPNKYKYTATSTYLNAIQINEKPYSISVNVNTLNDLSLKYNHNQISIETGIIDYYSKGTSHIRYKLNDGTWQYGPARYTIRYQDLQPGKYILQMQSSNAANEFIGPIKTLNITIAPPFWRTWWAYSFYLLASIGAIRGLVQYRSKALIRRNEILEEKIEFMNLKQRASELETRALKAQMNPHFIFNCLNSINNFILKSDKSQASEYLIKFSKLIRLILENSNKALVSLDQELDALSLYVSLEKLRFDHELEFKLSHDDDVDTASIKVPPLILQPFVENALHHGLLPKQGIGILNVRIEELDQTLHIEIEDNGIGREQAHQVKKSDLQHESMGMKLTNERIALMNNDHTKSTVSVQDLHDSNGQPTGTKVIINIPKII